MTRAAQLNVMFMALDKYFNLERLDYLIQRKATGTPESLARRFNVSPRTIYNYINELKNLGATIDYDHRLQTYFYIEAPTESLPAFAVYVPGRNS